MSELTDDNLFWCFTSFLFSTSLARTWNLATKSTYCLDDEHDILLTSSTRLPSETPSAFFQKGKGLF